MKRREFFQASAGFGTTAFLQAQTAGSVFSLADCAVVCSPAATMRERKACAVLAEEAEKRCGVHWPVRDSAPGTGVAIYAATRANWSSLGPRAAAVARNAGAWKAEGFTIETGADAAGAWIAVAGTDERGLLFGVGKLLQTLAFGRQRATADPRRLHISSSPRYPLRGHQLGYRPKTNAYDAWTVPVWDQYIRDLALFGTNAIELVPPRTDDGEDSPLFPLPKGKMMTEMSRLADSYGMDAWIWYPAMDRDYSNPATVEAALREWGHIFESLPRVDAVFVPGGDPGHTQPRYLLALLEKQKQNLRKYHPKAQMWVSPQSFTQTWMDEFFEIAGRPATRGWLDGVVYGPQSRVSLKELRDRLPASYPVRFYPDITHSLECQYPVAEWDVAYALTEGRETINPRPVDQANILRRYSPLTTGFITYSEGCNDDVNKFVWSALGWDPEQSVTNALRDYSRYFFGHELAEGFAQGLLGLERNWRGPLAANTGVDTTLARFGALERRATPEVLGNWRFQQGLYRAYSDAAVRSRLLDEEARVRRATDILSTLRELGWMPEPLEIEAPLSAEPPNGRDPMPVIEAALRVLDEGAADPAGRPYRARVRELGEALYQSIRMQLAVQRYRGEAVVRGANLETLDYPVTDLPWLRAQLARIRKLEGPHQQVRAALELVNRADPGPEGFYDELGNPANRPHLIPGPGATEDPEFRASALTGFDYPDSFGARTPIAWKRWGETLFETPLRVRYTDLDREAQYRVRVVYSGEGPSKKIRLGANGNTEIHPLLTRPWPPRPVEFAVPKAATGGGTLELAWTREAGLGGSGRGAQVSEVWLLKVEERAK